uniref:ATP synthase complex subunit 8 n=1 Tax=Ablepharus himalayanus TaxID=3147705 RepID=A0A8E5NVQ6_9SAUR|nr:ATP synthase F0 subunit 8 [Asymblepharus himalayanus]QVH34644.1 ATP synthase F0 subunit 8 [Asymblepharus himalayanus]
MPQLNPAPWLFILFMLWLTVLVVFKTKTLCSTSLNTMTPYDQTTQHTTSWDWPWT